jgi:hypothetical protein
VIWRRAIAVDTAAWTGDGLLDGIAAWPNSRIEDHFGALDPEATRVALRRGSRTLREEGGYEPRQAGAQDG